MLPRRCETRLERIEQVRWAVHETDGKIAIVPEPPGDDPLARR